MGARGQDVNHLYMLFRQVIGLSFSLRNSPSFGMREVFPSENHSGYSSPLLETSLKLPNTPFYRVPARFHQKFVILSGPGALQLLFLDRNLTASATTRAHSSPVSGGTFSWIAIFTSCNQAVFLFPVPLSSHNFLQNPFASSMLSNIRESSRAPFPGSLCLGRSFSGSLFNISLKFANTLPGTVLNCWLITRETSCFFFLSNPRFNFRSSDFFFSM